MRLQISIAWKGLVGYMLAQHAQELTYAHQILNRAVLPSHTVSAMLAAEAVPPALQQGFSSCDQYRPSCQSYELFLCWHQACRHGSQGSVLQWGPAV